jgi:C1A family cysteine protease
MTFKRVALVCLVALVLIAIVTAAPKGRTLTVREINAAIKAQHAAWKAVENRFTWMTAAERRLRLGGFPPEITAGADMVIDQAKPGPTLPTSFDWRNQNGYNWMTPVRDQGNCGSCWAFGTLAALEAKMQIYFSNPNLSPDLSEQFVVSCDTSNYGCSGGYADRVYNFIRDTGAPDEACFRYQAEDLPCSDRCGDWASRVHKIASWSWVCTNKANTTNIKNAVYTNGPLTCHMDVYTDFFSYGSGCYTHVTGAFEGGHMVCITGWTADGCWIVKNSWGTSWGEQGYFKIKFGNCRIGTTSGKFVYAGN